MTKDGKDISTLKTVYTVDLGELLEFKMADHAVTPKGHLVRKDYEPMTPFLASVPVADCYGDLVVATAVADAYQRKEYQRLEDRFGFLKKHYGISLDEAAGATA